jgi:glycosyltransferase involved in cell wall biosynthesis
VDLEKFNKLPREDDKFRVIYVGGIQARKGILYLLEAFTKLKGLDAELILVGTVYPEMRKTMKKYEGTYKYFPPVEQPKLKKFYSNSSVFVIPSIDDGFAMVTAEAMACGLPIIVTTNTGISDVIEEERHGFVVPIRDSEAIADKIEILYREKSLLEYMSTEAQLKSKGLTWNTYGEKMMEIYKGLLKENKI